MRLVVGIVASLLVVVGLAASVAGVSRPVCRRSDAARGDGETESGFRANMGTSSAGAFGYGQFTAPTWASQGGGGNPYDFHATPPAMARYLCHLGYASDPARALNAYGRGTAPACLGARADQFAATAGIARNQLRPGTGLLREQLHAGSEPRGHLTRQRTPDQRTRRGNALGTYLRQQAQLMLDALSGDGVNILTDTPPSGSTSSVCAARPTVRRLDVDARRTRRANCPGGHLRQRILPPGAVVDPSGRCRRRRHRRWTSRVRSSASCVWCPSS